VFLWQCLSLICLHPNLSVLRFFGNVTLATYISQQHITNSYPSAIQLITILLPLTCPQHLNSSSKTISRLCVLREGLNWHGLWCVHTIPVNANTQFCAQQVSFAPLAPLYDASGNVCHNDDSAKLLIVPNC